jgi:hypothetical protein
MSGKVTVAGRQVDFDAAVNLMDNEIREELHSTMSDDFVPCESADGWSLHAPGSTDAEIASGDAPALVSGPWEGDEHVIPASGYETARQQAFADAYAAAHQKKFGERFQVI